MIEVLNQFGQAFTVIGAIMVAIVFWSCYFKGNDYGVKDEEK